MSCAHAWHSLIQRQFAVESSEPGAQARLSHSEARALIAEKEHNGMLASVRRQLLEEQHKVQQLQQAGAAMRQQFDATLRAHEDKHASALHALAIEIDRLRGARSSRTAELEAQLAEAQRTVERERDEMRRLTETLQDELQENHCALTSLVRESSVRADMAEAISAQLQRRVEEQAEEIESLSARLRALPAVQHERSSESAEPAHAASRPSVGSSAHVHEPLMRPSAAGAHVPVAADPDESIDTLHARAGTWSACIWHDSEPSPCVPICISPLPPFPSLPARPPAATLFLLIGPRQFVPRTFRRLHS